MRLGGLSGQSRVQLNGFKSRALRSNAPAQRHLYLTEWCSIGPAEAQHRAPLVIGDATFPAKYQRLSRPDLAADVSAGTWAVISMALTTPRSSYARGALSALELALALVQAQPSAPLWAPWLEGRSHWGYTLVRGRPVSPEGEDKGRFASGALRPCCYGVAIG